MTIQELLQARVTCRDDAKAITALAEKDKRELTADESTAHGEHTAKFDALSIDLANARDKQDERSAIRAKEIEMDASLASSPGRLTTPPPVGETPPTSEMKAKVTRERILDDPKKGFKNSRQFLTSVMDATRNPGLAMPDGLKVLRFAATVGSDEQMTVADPYGGFLVPESFSPTLMQLDPEADPIGGLTRRVPMATPTVRIPVRADKTQTSSAAGGITVSRRAETAGQNATRTKYEQLVLEAHSLFGFTYATEELLTDSAITFAALVAANFADQFTYHLIDERINGTGVGEFMGIVNSGCFINQGIENGQATDTIVYENIIKMRSRVWGYPNAVWLANHDTMPQLMLMNQSVGAGGVPVWQPSAREDHPDILLGRPLIFTQYVATLGDANDIMCCNWGEYLEGIYQPMQSAESIHVRFLNHERAFKFWLRNAGMPWWREKLTPKKSSITLSPFVGLVTR